MAKFCPNCGRMLDDNAAFCANCGTRMAVPSAAPVSYPAPAPAPQMQAPGAQKKSGRGGLIAGIIAGSVIFLAALVLAGGFIWPGFFKTKEAPQAQTPVTQTQNDPEPEPEPQPQTPKTEQKAMPKAEPKTDPKPKPDPEPEPEPEPEPFVNPFTDISENDYFYKAAMWAAQNGILTGTSFRPSDPATRADAISFLWRSKGAPEPTLKSSPYDDVKKEDSFFKAVCWAFENNVLTAASDGLFRPDDAMSKAQAITFLYRVEKADGGESADRAFADVKPNAWYYDAANWAYSEGLIARGDDWAFNPNAEVNRGQFITYLDRAMDPEAELAEPNVPEAIGFADYGIVTRPLDSGPWRFNSVSYPDTSWGLKADVSLVSYSVFDSDDSHASRAGYEWHRAAFRISFANDENAKNHGAQFDICWNDYYNTRLFDDSGTNLDDGSQVYTVIWDGMPAEVYFHYGSEKEDSLVFLWTFEYEAPKGYDGMVVGFYNSLIEDSGYILDYYTDTEDFALFRLD